MVLPHPEHPRFLLDADYGDTRAARSWADALSARQVVLVAAGTMAVFYALQLLRRPRRMATMIKRVLARRPVTWAERAVLGRTRRRRFRAVAPPAPAVEPCEPERPRRIAAR